MGIYSSGRVRLITAVKEGRDSRRNFSRSSGSRGGSAASPRPSANAFTVPKTRTGIADHRGCFLRQPDCLRLVSFADPLRPWSKSIGNRDEMMNGLRRTIAQYAMQHAGTASVRKHNKGVSRGSGMHRGTFWIIFFGGKGGKEGLG